MRNFSQIAALLIGAVLGASLLTLGPNLSGAVSASGSKDSLGQEAGRVIGLASDALECLGADNDIPAQTSGVVNLTWQGQAERARLVLSVAGSEATHVIKVNGQPAASAPIYPDGQPCSAEEYVYLDISPELLVQGDNLIEITDSALAGDTWTAANVRLEVFGDVTSLPEGADSADQIGAADVTVAAYTLIFSFTNSYDGSAQEAIAQIPDGYDPGTSAPLLIAVHARNGTKETGLDWFDNQADERGWLLASPELHGSWPIPPECFVYPNDCSYDDQVLAGTTGPDADPRPGAYAYASPESQYDVIGAVNYMIQSYNVDPHRIYLAGYSMGGQGGVVTAAKFPHLFAAVFDNKGPTDMDEWYDEQEAFYGTSGEPVVRAMRKECHNGGTPQTPAENPFCYQRRSGIHFAGNYLHIPISMTHSTSDALVPIHHSRDLRDAINGYDPDQPASVYEDTIIGPTCPPSHHCYEPDPAAVLDFLEPFTLKDNPTQINITSDESKSYYWMNLAQTGADHWSQIEAAYYPISATVTATVSDTEPLTIGFNLGSTPILGLIEQPGMGLPATTYLVKGGGNHHLHDYTSGYLTITLNTTSQYTLTISAIAASLSANPAMVSGRQSTTSTITAVSKDQLDNPVPDGTAIQFSTTEGTFPNGSSVLTTNAVGGKVTTTLTLTPGADAVEITASVGSITASTAIDVIYPAIDVLVTPDQSTIYRGEVVTYTYRLANIGDTTLTGVTVLDDNGTPGNNSDDLTVCANITLPAGAMRNCRRSATLYQDTTNTATVTGQDPLGYDVSDSDSTTVSVRPPEVKIYLPFVTRKNRTP